MELGTRLSSGRPQQGCASYLETSPLSNTGLSQLRCRKILESSAGTFPPIVTVRDVYPVARRHPFSSAQRTSSAITSASSTQSSRTLHGTFAQLTRVTFIYDLSVSRFHRRTSHEPNLPLSIPPLHKRHELWLFVIPDPARRIPASNYHLHGHGHINIIVEDGSEGGLPPFHLLDLASRS